MIDDCRRPVLYKRIQKWKLRSKSERQDEGFVGKSRIIKNQVDELEQNITMKLQAKAQRLKKYSKRNYQFHLNRTFKNYAKKFYRQITSRQIKVINPLKQQAVGQFWKDILENEMSYNFEANWIDVEETLLKEMKKSGKKVQIGKNGNK